MRVLFLLTALIMLASCADKEYEKRGNTVVLMYHTLLDGTEVPAENLSITTNAEKFESDIAALIDSGYKPISLNRLYENKNKGAKYFAVTFDDGYLSNYEIAFPILKKYNCYADIFINTDNEYMEHHFSFAQAREMEKSGLITIHSHFPVHEDVRDYSAEAFTRGLNKSFDTLTAELGRRKHRFFAYPFSAYNDATYDIAVANGVGLQFVQDDEADKSGFIIRENVSYDTDILKLLETAYWN